MSLLIVPPEILQQILGEALLYPNFSALRLVHSHLNTSIISSAGLLTRSLLANHVVSDHILRLYSQANLEIKKSSGGELPILLNLHKDVATCVLLEEILETYRQELTAFPIWADVPSRPFGNVESILLLSAFQRHLQRGVKTAEKNNSTATVLMASQRNDNIVGVKLHQNFLDFLRIQLTSDDFHSLMTIVNFCAVSSHFISSNLNSGHFYEIGLSSDHWQNEQLGSALLAERILWKGPSWLYRMMNRNVDVNASVVAECQTKGEERNKWLGSREEAVRLTADGLARLLWKERINKIAREEEEARASDVKTIFIKRELRVDPAVWRGSAGGM